MGEGRCVLYTSCQIFRHPHIFFSLRYPQCHICVCKRDGILYILYQIYSALMIYSAMLQNILTPGIWLRLPAAPVREG